MRRGHTPTSPQIALGLLTLDLVGRRAHLADEPLELTVREWGIIELFVTQPGVALSKERIVQSLSSWDEKLSQNAVEVYISRLRAKLEPHGVQIRTVRGFGYLLETPRGP
jgi:two-component system OmpR family response regulator